MPLPCPTRPFCATTTTNLSYTWLSAATNLADVTWCSVRRRMAGHRFSRDFQSETGSWATAACFFSLPIRCNTEEIGSNDPSHRSVRASATAIDPPYGRHNHCGGNRIVPSHAGGRLSRSLAANGGDHHQWPGHAAEEVERLVTVPTEVQMSGAVNLSVMRSISLYGLSDVILTFNEGTDNYFARQQVFERLSEVTYPAGVTPTLAPLASPSGLVYRYVLESPDRTPQELKTLEDWVIAREYKQVPGVADDSGFGGTVMQYQVLLDPAKLYAYHITVPTVVQQLSSNNSNAGGGFYSQGGQFYYVRGIGLIRNTSDIGNIIVGTQNGVPVRIRDIGSVVIGNAPRLGEFGFNKLDDAVEGVIMMRRGEQTQNVLKGVEAKTDDLNNGILPPDVKVHPYYDRSDLVQLTIDTVEHNMLLGMALVLLVLMAFLVSIRAAVIVALTIPLALLFSFIFLHARGVAANLLSIGAIDFGILIDGTLVMVENIFRELGVREGQDYDLHEVILSAAKDVDRPIFYSVA